MLYFIPWAVLIVAVIVAVPVAAKMSPSQGGSRRRRDKDDNADPIEGEAEDQVVLADEFGSGDAGAFGDEGFEEFK